MSTQVNEPTVRPKNQKQDDQFVTIRVPKETGDDDRNPDALIHRYHGEESEFKDTKILKETPRSFIVQADKAQMLAYRKRAEQEAKDRVKAKAGIKGTSEIIRGQGGIPMDQLVAELKGRVLKELPDANG